MLTLKDAAEMAQQALKLLENASATISVDRRQKTTHYLNWELSNLVKDQKTFTDTASLLFGKDFDKQAKEHHWHSDAVCSLRDPLSVEDLIGSWATPTVQGKQQQPKKQAFQET